MVNVRVTLTVLPAGETAVTAHLASMSAESYQPHMTGYDPHGTTVRIAQIIGGFEIAGRRL